MDVVVHLNGQPVLLYDPVYINALTKFLLNNADQSRREPFQFIFDLYQKKKHKKKKIEQTVMSEIMAYQTPEFNI